MAEEKGTKIDSVHIRQPERMTGYANYCGDSGGSISFDHFISEQENVMAHVETLPICHKCLISLFNDIGEIHPEIVRRAFDVKVTTDNHN